MLRADGEADRVGLDAGLRKLLGVHLGVGRAGGVDDEGLGVGDVGQLGEELQLVDKRPGFLRAALDFKGED